MAQTANISIPQAILGVIITVFLSVGGSYMGLEKGAVEREAAIKYLREENVNRKQEVKEVKAELAQVRDQYNEDNKEILGKLTEIMVTLERKANR